jgi:hypothetical protein
MRLPSKNSRQWRILAFFVLGLAIAVFAWGLRYKTSLYNSAPPPSHHMLAAKLLSNRERPSDVVVQVEHATAPSLIAVCVAFALSSSLLLDPKRQSRWTIQRSLNPQRRPIPGASLRILFRPPPSRGK